MISPQQIKEAAQRKKQEHQLLLKVLRKTNKKEVDKIFHQLHDETFEKFDCLTCANCCKTTGPLFTSTDINRISGKMKLSEKDFIEKFLRKDEDGDMVLQSIPCPFLGDDNYCIIYDFRPKACREYPHTDRINQHQILALTFKNAEVCPAVFDLLEKAKNQLK